MFDSPLIRRGLALVLDPSDRTRAASIVYYAALAVLCGMLGVIGFRICEQTNFSLDGYDQGAYRGMVEHLKGSWYPWYSDGTRNPLFPWLASWVLNPADPDFLVRGKKFNVLLAVLSTAVVGCFFRRRMGRLAAFNCTTLAGLGALLPISTFFGAEAVFLVLFLFVCVMGLRLLNDNPLWLYPVLGLTAAAAWLAKPSTTPFLGLLICWSGVRWLLNAFGKSHLPWHLSAPRWSGRRFILGIGLLAVVFGILVSPRLLHAHRTWGSATYSLPGFWFWADDWASCVEKYRDCRQITLRHLPPHDQPTWRGYFLRNTPGQALDRLTSGATKRLEQFFHPEGKWRFPYDKHGKPKRVVLPHRGFYIIALGLLIAVLTGLTAWHGRLSAMGPVTLPILLALSTFVVYVLATGWYFPIGNGHRFVMTLYLPAVWMLSQGAEQLRQACRPLTSDGVFLAFHIGLGGLLTYRLGILLFDGHFDRIQQAF